MSLHKLLLKRAAERRPVRVGVIGTGPLARAFLAQARFAAGLHVMAVVDPNRDKALAALAAAGWPEERYAATSSAKAIGFGTTWVTDDAEAMITAGGLEVVVESTESAHQGIRHALAAFRRGRHVVMANLLADTLAGPLLALHAVRAQVVYSLALGQAPAQLAEQIDRARACGFGIVSSGRGMAFGPKSHGINPTTVWKALGLTAKDAKADGADPATLVSAADGTRAALEMASASNATGMLPPPRGLGFTPCTGTDLPGRMVPKADGGILDGKGTMDVVSGLDAKGKPLDGALGDGTFVVLESEAGTVARIFDAEDVASSTDGRYVAVWRPDRLGGPDLALSAASAALRDEPTGVPTDFRADVVAYAKKGLDSGQILDGEGGYTVYGVALPASEALDKGYLPLGLAAGARLKTHIAINHPIRWFDVEVDPNGDEADILQFRKEMETHFAGRTAKNFK